MSANRRYGIRAITGIHKFWYRTTNGLIGGNLFGAKVLLLTTMGRKSGRRYVTPLTYYEDGANIVIIASNNGSDSDPNWWRNLKAHPSAEVQVGAKHRAVVAEAALGDDRDRLWAAVTERYPTYLRYEKATKRAIPVIVLCSQVPTHVPQ